MLNVKNRKENNCWLSIYVLSINWIETPDSIKYFLFHRVPQTDAHLGLSFFKESRKGSILGASAAFRAHTDLDRIRLYKYFLIASTMILKMEFYSPFFFIFFFAVNFFIYYALEETSLSNYFIICYTKKYICEWLHYFGS